MECYTQVDNTTRNKLSDLFNTWKIPVTGSHSLSPVFPTEDTYKIEEALARMRAVQERSAYGSPAPWQQMSRPPVVDQLLQDISGLLRTLDTRVRINPDDHQSRDLMGKLMQLCNLLETTVLRPYQLDEIRDQLRGIASLCAQPVSRIHTPVPASQPPMDLFAQLAMAGMIDSGTAIQAPHLVDLNSQAMLVSRPELIELLYGSMPLQCYQCGQRWHDSPTERTLKDEHLDWHFKTNKRLRELSVRAQSRALYIAETDWITFTIETTTKEQAAPDTVTAAQINSSVPKPSDPAQQNATCPICKENFETVWDDAAENWMWKNAVDVGGTICHATCYAEATAAQKRSDAKTALKEDKPDSDEDIALPMHNGVKIEPNVDDPVIKKEEETTPFVLEDALRSIAGVLGTKRRLSDDGSEDRRIKAEPSPDE